MNKTLEMLMRENELLTKIIQIHQDRLQVLETKFAEFVQKTEVVPEVPTQIEVVPEVPTQIEVVPEVPTQIEVVPEVPTPMQVEVVSVNQSNCWCR
jgi:hypothetical protein